MCLKLMSGAAIAAAVCVGTFNAAIAATYRMVIQSLPEVGGKCLDVANGQFVRGMPIQMWDCNNTVSQTFGYDDAKQLLSIGNLCVEVWGAGNIQDAVGLGVCNEQPNQRWRMVAIKDYYQIIGPNNRCLEVRGGIKTNGAALDVQDCDAKAPHRLWALLEAPSESAAAANPAPGAAGATATAAASLRPDCHTDQYTFSTLLSESVSANSVSSGGGACSYSIAPTHPDKVQFTSAAIVKRPRNGTFEQVGAFAFKYQPNSAFKGADECAIKVCGHSSDRAGCATITYHVVVN